MLPDPHLGLAAGDNIPSKMENVESALVLCQTDWEDVLTVKTKFACFTEESVMYCIDVLYMYVVVGAKVILKWSGHAKLHPNSAHN